jgi:hypothetical protein
MPAMGVDKNAKNKRREREGEFCSGKLPLVLSLLFVASLCLILLTFPYRFASGDKKVSALENRELAQKPELKLKTFADGKYQGGLENYFSDQFIGGGTLKKIYKVFEDNLFQSVVNLYYENNTGYLPKAGGGWTYRDDEGEEYLVGFPGHKKLTAREEFNNAKNLYSKAAINMERIAPKDSENYLMCIEGEFDFRETQSHATYKYLKSVMKNYEVGVSETSSFEDYKEKFQRTDGHWNHKGAHSFYIETLKLLGIKDKPIEPAKTVDMDYDYVGDYARKLGLLQMKEKAFCFKYAYPKYLIKVNGKIKNKWVKTDVAIADDKNELKRIKKEELMPYGYLFGGNNAMVEVAMDKPVRDENLLIIGYSMSRVLTMPLAMHFNKTYSLDFRLPEAKNLGLTFEDFSLKNFVKKYDISKVLIVGDFFNWLSGWPAAELMK